MSKKKQNIQVGNFLISRESGSEHDWIVIRAVSGNWSMRYRDDNGMFLRVRELANDKELHNYLEVFIKTVYLIGNTTPDTQFFQEFYKSYNELAERLVSLQKQATPEEDATNLEAVKTLVDINNAKA